MSQFVFKSFSVNHSNSSMKVGTDAVLLGAWSAVDGANRILDVGCGCGVISLMAAQRNPDAMVVGIDIDAASIQEANGNFGASKFAARLEALEQNVYTFAPPLGFDCILSNPPFFSEKLLPPSQRRAAARNSNLLPFQDLIANAIRLMNTHASLQVIIPTTEVDTFLSESNKQGLNLVRRMDVVTKPGKLPKRTLLHFVNFKLQEPVKNEMLVLSNSDNSRSDDYKMLAKDFYL